MNIRNTTAAIAATLGVAVAATMGLAAPAVAAGNNVVNAHCADIVLDLKDNPHEHDSRGNVDVVINGRHIYAAPLDTADFHRVLTDLGDVASGYEWTVAITHPYTGEQLFRTTGAVTCTPEPAPDSNPGPATEDVPHPDYAPQLVEPGTTAFIQDVPNPTYAPQLVEPGGSITVALPVPGGAIPTFPVVTIPGPEASTTDVVDGPTGAPAIDTPFSVGIHTPAGMTPAPTSAPASHDPKAGEQLPNLGGPSASVAMLAAGLVATGGALLIASRRSAK